VSLRVEDVVSQLAGLPVAQRREAQDTAVALTRSMAFIPNPGPQLEAYYSQADVLLFGGSPGGGKSGLGLGLGINEHHRSLILRKAFTDLEGLIDTAKKLIGSDDGFVGGSRPKYRKPDGGVMHFAGVSADGGIGGQQGVDHDYIYLDEAAQYPENQVRLIMGWLRTDRPGQRCRVVMGSNPPLDTVGDWLIEYFAPWLLDTHPNPAAPGELRYFLPDEARPGKDRECGKDDFTFITTADGTQVRVGAQSRTYIPSSFTDNPYYDREEYAKKLAGLPIEVRGRLMTGNFMLARPDNAMQVIPTAWVKAAQARWQPHPPPGIPMSAIGVDVAQGGNDETVLAPRFDGYYSELTKKPGRDTPNGASVAGLVVTVRRDQCLVVIDMGGGYGGAAFERLSETIGADSLVAYKGSQSSTKRTRDKKIAFTNRRSAAYWKFREALDPDQDGGSPIALPPSTVLLSDLCSPTFEVGPHGIKVEPKEDVCARLQRSTDEGDAVVMAWDAGLQVSPARGGQYRQDQRPTGGRGNGVPAVNLGPRRAAR
jgi:hypothetical protein